eukprot:1160088-Pelagomonas_calceolata.AAC.19
MGLSGATQERAGNGVLCSRARWLSRLRLPPKLIIPFPGKDAAAVLPCLSLARPLVPWFGRQESTQAGELNLFVVRTSCSLSACWTYKGFPNSEQLLRGQAHPLAII